MTTPDAGSRHEHPTVTSEPDSGASTGTASGPSPGAGHRAGVAVDGPRWARSALLLVPGLWLGLIVGISLLEAPLKFTAPGITIPLGLGIGRRVFLAMNIVELVLAVVLVVALVRTLGRPKSHPLWHLGYAVLTVLIVKVAVIRPLLNERTDAVLAGEFAGGSATHYFYVGAEALLLIALGAFLVHAVRAVVPAVPGQPGVDRPDAR